MWKCEDVPTGNCGKVSTLDNCFPETAARFKRTTIACREIRTRFLQVTIAYQKIRARFLPVFLVSTAMDFT